MRGKTFVSLSKTGYDDEGEKFSLSQPFLWQELRAERTNNPLERPTLKPQTSLYHGLKFERIENQPGEDGLPCLLHLLESYEKV